jgi:hypothetical protein
LFPYCIHPPSSFILPPSFFLLPRSCRKGVKAGWVWEGWCNGRTLDGVSGMPWDMSALPRDGERRILRCTVTVVCVCCVLCVFIVYFLCVSVCRSVCFHTSINITQVSLLLFRNTVFHIHFIHLY